MTFLLPKVIRKISVLAKQPLNSIAKTSGGHVYNRSKSINFKKFSYLLAIILDVLCLTIVISKGVQPAGRMISPLISPLTPLKTDKSRSEVFGFAPYWTFDKLSSINFDLLTTLAYFGVTVGDDGHLVKDDSGYQTFKSSQATGLFKKAHLHGSRVVLTLTQMDNGVIRDLMDDQNAQAQAIKEAVDEVDRRGIDGINVDFEYSGDPGQAYRDKFSNFVDNLTTSLHQRIPSSKLTVSVYASAVKDPKIYDIAALSKESDGIFMMAYDFAVASSDNAIPTSPLYGHKDGKYWYDVSTAVSDFLTLMPPSKLILGLPWYGYDYLVYRPEVKAQTRPYYSWRGQPAAKTYGKAAQITPASDNINAYLTGWDNEGQVGWKAYHLADSDTWRMIFVEDPKSLAIKYDFAISKNLAGVGIWALGFEEGRNELWQILADKFSGSKMADRSIYTKVINND